MECDGEVEPDEERAQEKKEDLYMMTRGQEDERHIGSQSREGGITSPEAGFQCDPRKDILPDPWVHHTQFEKCRWDVWQTTPTEIFYT